jgi:hypothetical protein
MKTKNLNIRLAEPWFGWLKQLCVLNLTTMSQQIRTLIQDEARKQGLQATTEKCVQDPENIPQEALGTDKLP